MRAGTLNRRVVLQWPITTQDATGEPIVTWTVEETVWAACEPGRGREFYAEQQIMAERPMLFRVRHRVDVTTLTRVLYLGDIYNIDTVMDYRDERRETWMYARSGLNEG